MNISSFVVAAVALTFVCVPALAEDELLRNDWFAQFHGETKTGWSHTRRVRTTSGGRTVIITESQGQVVRGPDGKLMSQPIVSAVRFEEDEAGKVLSYSSSVDIGFGPQTRNGSVKDGVISAVEDGKARSFPYPEGVVGPAASDRALLAALKPGGTAKVREFAPLDAGKGQEISFGVPKETKLVNVLGRFAWLFPVTKTDATAIPETLLLDGAGQLLGGDLNFGTIRYLRTEEVVAKADRSPDTWLTSRILPPNRVIPTSARRARTLLRLSRTEGVASGHAFGDLLTTRTQKIVERAKDGSVHVELLDGEPKGDLVLWARPYVGDDIDKASLAKTPLVELDNPRVNQMASGMVGKLEDGLSCARVLELNVKLAVRATRANVGFNSTAGVISARMGDSTETAVLAVGLARSLGLPARLVAGLVYRAPDDWPKGSRPNGAFVFHAWAEIYAGRELWFAIDPIRMDGTQPKKQVSELIGHGGFDATHIAVLRSDLATEQPFTDIVLPVLRFMDGLQIEVLEPKE